MLNRLLAHLGAGVLVAVSLVGCEEPGGDYLAASDVAHGPFARNGAELRGAHGREIRLWGYVDYANLYGDAGARDILGEFWSGEGPNPAAWRFDLKAGEDDAAGQSFAVHVPNDDRRDEVLRVLVANARAGRSTKVFLSGRLFSFAAPTNVRTLTGLYMELQSAADIRFREAQRR